MLGGVGLRFFLDKCSFQFFYWGWYFFVCFFSVFLTSVFKFGVFFLIYPWSTLLNPSNLLQFFVCFFPRGEICTYCRLSLFYSEFHHPFSFRDLLSSHFCRASFFKYIICFFQETKVCSWKHELFFPDVFRVTFPKKNRFIISVYF